MACAKVLWPEELDFLSNRKTRGQRGSWVDAVGEGEGRERHRGHKGHGRSWILLPGCWESVQGSHRERAVMHLYLEKIGPAAVGRLSPQGQEGWRKWSGRNLTRYWVALSPK